MFNTIIIGAGYAGLVLAERLASQQNQKVLVIEQRQHIGGNAYDRFDEYGVLIHEYGPHIFHTRSKEVWHYLSQFTEWYYYEHRVLTKIDGKEVPIPFNLNTINEVFPKEMAERIQQKLVSLLGYNVRVPILKLREQGDEDLKFLADYVYDKIFLNYTLKQWGIGPEELDPTVTGRVPLYISRDDRYFQDKYQGLPKFGYTEMFKKMLDHPNIHLMLNTKFQDVMTISESGHMLFGQTFEGHIIYTGSIDELFDYTYGELPYRSLRFEYDTFNVEYKQTVGQLNSPNGYDFTRITEFKHLTGQMHSKTTLAREYPEEYVRGENTPYYPIITEENQEKYKQYKKLADSLTNVHLVGRLAEYKYYDMDAVVAAALKLYNKLK
ncbi:UDP-galactopyranose mutase [Lysinibacillus boronitolerans]|uniref:UDP-galactopyranose mutase n=1 Tax=Lysinibacillus boronitolerans JCM 21713 = 10a = NBRC 103108 TaxID=1294264 RepID=A0ABR4Y130_9BACI|nr:UDP-galactopyranose mutase [Lysinibacillus boronitolerans]KGR86917.1 UDP-galactopyranose mutase [Lysinibacillus boronitolerans JCM 21713 = 10a = NBRC 103108]